MSSDIFMLCDKLLCCLIPHTSVAEPHHFYAAPAPGKNLDAAPAPAPTLLYSQAIFLKGAKVSTHVETIFFI
jgi:hypothetical protein